MISQNRLLSIIVLIMEKASTEFKARQHQKMASQVVGTRVLDVGYQAAPNKFLCEERRHVVGYDIATPVETTCYDETIQGDVANIRSVLAGREFDSILLGAVIEHLETPYQALRDLNSLLAEGGRLILSTPNPLGFPVLFFELLNFKRFFYTEEHLYYFLPRWVGRMLRVTGYHLEKILPVGLWILPVPCPKILSYSLIYVARKR